MSLKNTTVKFKKKKVPFFDLGSPMSEVHGEEERKVGGGEERRKGVRYSV